MVKLKDGIENAEQALKYMSGEDERRCPFATECPNWLFETKTEKEFVSIGTCLECVTNYFKPHCPECGKPLTYEDYETYYDEEVEDTSSFILCSHCGYDERDVWDAE